MTATREGLGELLARVRACRVCEEHLPLDPRPVLRAEASARVLLAGQAPGTRVHETGIPWNDPSGDRLRAWIGIGREEFYDAGRIAIIPTGFCYPGKRDRGDLPPRPECAPLWMPELLERLPNLRLKVLLGGHAIAWHLGRRRRRTLGDTVRAWEEYLPEYFPLPHPSPRNILWLRRRPWFEEEVLPALRERFREALSG